MKKQTKLEKKEQEKEKKTTKSEIQMLHHD